MVSRRWIRDAEPVACLARIAIKRDERGETGGIDALDVLEIECNVLPAHQRLEALKQQLFVAAHQFGHFQNGERWSDLRRICSGHGTSVAESFVPAIAQSTLVALARKIC